MDNQQLQLQKLFFQKNQQDLYQKWISNVSLNEDEIILILENLYELHLYPRALDFVYKTEDKIAKRYYDFAPYKINALIRNKKYEEAKRIVSNELELPYIPMDFEQFLKGALKEIRFLEKTDQLKVQIEDLETLDQLDETTLLLVLPQLKYFNLIPFCNQIQNLFTRNDLSNQIKSLLLAILSDMKLNHDFIISKNHLLFHVNPTTVKDLREFKSFLYIQKLVMDNQKNMNVNVIQYFNEIIKNVYLDLYPEEISIEDATHLFYAIVQFLNESTSIDTNLNIQYQEYLSKFKDKTERFYKIICALFKNV